MLAMKQCRAEEGSRLQNTSTSARLRVVDPFAVGTRLREATADFTWKPEPGLLTGGRSSRSCGDRPTRSRAFQTNMQMNSFSAMDGPREKYCSNQACSN
jgi:hypothetical protein